MTLVSNTPALLFGGIILAVLLHHLFGGLLHIFLRTGCSYLFLYFLSRVPLFSCIALGVNPINALVLGVLGAPGFALLLMLRWMLHSPSFP